LNVFTETEPWKFEEFEGVALNWIGEKCVVKMSTGQRGTGSGK
jgi:hypothetical protein